MQPRFRTPSASSALTLHSDIEQRGDRALLELSQKFDNWALESFRPSEGEIAACVGQLTPGQLEDIKFAQKQIRNFAQLQKDSLHDIEVETLPGVILGHKNLPVAQSQSRLGPAQRRVGHRASSLAMIVRWISLVPS